MSEIQHGPLEERHRQLGASFAEFSGWLMPVAYEGTVGEHTAYQVPILEFRGTPTGIDVAAVVRTGILPQINTGMAGRVAGIGQVGAGLVNPPAQCFTAALEALAEQAGA